MVLLKMDLFKSIPDLGQAKVIRAAKAAQVSGPQFARSFLCRHQAPPNALMSAADPSQSLRPRWV